MTLLDRADAALYFSHQYTAYPTEQKVLSTLALLILGYYVLTFFDAWWPSTVKRSVHDLFISLLPSPAIYAMQYGLTRIGGLSLDDARFRRADFGNAQAKSEALQRMFGHGRVPNMFRKARSLSGIDNLISLNNEIGPPGLGNWDNSCYQNSILQGLASLPAFHSYIDRSLELCSWAGVSAETHRALAAFLRRLNQVDRPKTTLWTPSVLKSMDSWQQQDAQEYFSRVLEAVDKEAIKYAAVLKRRGRWLFGALDLESLVDQDERPTTLTIPSVADIMNGETENPNIVPTGSATSRNKSSVPFISSMYRNPIDGLLAQGLECTTCGFSEGLSFTQFNCLTLNLGLKGHSHLEELLDEYTMSEEVDGVECTNCTKLAAGDNTNTTTSTTPIPTTHLSPSSSDAKQKAKPVLRTKAKQITIGRLPKDLVIHINRSIFDDFGNQRKNTSLVRFPARLDFLRKWCAPLDVDLTRVQAVYELKCVVTHYGRHDNGHYVALGKRGKHWYCFNDDVVTQVPEEEVLNRGNVFMLFYEASPDLPEPKTPASEFSPDAMAEDMHQTESSTEDVNYTEYTDATSLSSSEADARPEDMEPSAPLPAMRTAGALPGFIEADHLTTPTVVSPL